MSAEGAGDRLGLGPCLSLCWLPMPADTGQLPAAPWGRGKLADPPSASKPPCKPLPASALVAHLQPMLTPTTRPLPQPLPLPGVPPARALPRACGISSCPHSRGRPEPRVFGQLLGENGEGSRVEMGNAAHDLQEGHDGGRGEMRATIGRGSDAKERMWPGLVGDSGPSQCKSYWHPWSNRAPTPPPLASPLGPWPCS